MDGTLERSAADREPRVLIVAENASARFGGEAALPLHYYRELRARGTPAWLLTHGRTRQELSEVFPGDPNIHYVEDTAWHRAMWRIGRRLPAQISYLTTEFLSRIYTQIVQRRIARKLIRQHAIDVVHQPIPVSPREPSLLYGLGRPVVMGPMNGGMNYPPAFAANQGRIERILLGLGRASASALNFVIPGKRLAALLLVANERTRNALPGGTCRSVRELVENGVDLSLWQPPAPTGRDSDGVTTFVFMGRLIRLKCVDLLLRAFADARRKAPMRLWVLGDGEERDQLQRLAADLGIEASDPNQAGGAHFAGWLSQAACKEWLSRADCLVLPSVRECGGAVVLEAMSLGKPVIATAWGGPLDYLDANCGVLVAPDSRDGFAQGIEAAMLRMATSPEERRRMGERALAKVRAEYAWSSKADRMVDLYALAVRSQVAPGEDLVSR